MNRFFAVHVRHLFWIPLLVEVLAALIINGFSILVSPWNTITTGVVPAEARRPRSPTEVVQTFNRDKTNLPEGALAKYVRLIIVKGGKEQVFSVPYMKLEVTRIENEQVSHLKVFTGTSRSKAIATLNSFSVVGGYATTDSAEGCHVAFHTLSSPELLDEGKFALVIERWPSSPNSPMSDSCP